MAGESSEGAEFKGWKKHFNSTTNYGRANVTKLTYAVIASIILYKTLMPKKK